ncbi:HAD-IA family hydrolase [Prochlorococcus marinus]|uniref:HAD-IA family hydrolase n=1 Tax=Prochlorococcus marinus TaxID=1219 RepID=UPI0022B46791|nr:HAD-IA family hydrolase [Prochlorococcus marinus]
MHKLKAVFWDVDGTIADTELCGHRVAFNLAFKDFNLDWHWNESKYLDLLKISGGYNRIIHYRNEIHSEITESQCSEIQSRKRLHYMDLIKSGCIKIREGVLRLINELSSFDVQQFIVTTSGRDSLDPFLTTSLSSHLKYFSEIITYEDVSKHKPFPDAYKLALQLSKELEVNCIAIEDSIIGVEAAKAANLNCLLTLPPWFCSTQKISRKANACVNSLGNNDVTSKLIYGKKLITNNVDFEYLTTIIN